MRSTTMQQNSKRALTLMMCAALLAALIMPFVYFGAKAADPVLPPYLNVKLSAAERAADLVSRMTIQEKQAQLKAQAPAIPRLGVAAYMYQNEGLHGVAKFGGTSFPSPIGTASSWNTDLMKQVGSATSDEARGYYNSNSSQGLSYWSPTINLHRDPRWGRNEESYSEDPFLTAAMGEAFVDGMQNGTTPVVNTNTGLNYLKAIPTLKHYAANNSEGNRDTGTSNMNNALLRDYYTWAFQQITEKENVSSVMASYNAINGIPNAANSYLLNTLLRKTFGFTGYVVGDCGALTYIVERQNYVKSYPEAVALGLKAGTDQDCGGGTQNWIYDKYAVDAVNQGYMTEADMDKALVDTFTERFKTGEFDSTSAFKDLTWNTTAQSQKDRDLALTAAQQAAILLQDNNSALPINTSTASNINVYGPLMNRTDLGDYSGNPTQDMQSFKTGFSDYLANNTTFNTANVHYNDGLTPTIVDNTQNMVNVRWIGFGPTQIKKAALDASSYTGMGNESGSNNNLNDISDGSYAVYDNIDLNQLNGEIRVWSGTVRDYSTQAIFHLDSLDGPTIATVTLPPNYRINPDGSRDWHAYGNTTPTGFSAITSANWYNAGFSTKAPAAPLGTVTMSSNGGAPKDTDVINYENMTQGSALNTDVIDQQKGDGRPRTVYVQFQYQRNNEIQTDAINAAEAGKDANSVSVVYVGMTSGFNGNYSGVTTSGYDPAANDSSKWGAFKVCSEGSDRQSINLPANQDALINAVATATKAHGGKVVVAMQTVGCVDVSAFKDNVDAIIWTPYNGQRQAEALSSLLVGKANPGGHTTDTWYKNDTQLTALPDGFYQNYDLLPSGTDGLGRTYMYFTQTPQYPFGYGLSYTSFTVSNVKIDKTSVAADGQVNVTADVKNTGSVAGAEVVQVYVKAPDAGQGYTPNEALKGFQRVELAAGASATVTITLNVSDFSEIDESTLSDYNPDKSIIDPENVDFNNASGGGQGARVVKTGDYKIYVGDNSSAAMASAPLTATVTSGMADALKLATLDYSKTVLMVGETAPAPALTVTKLDETFLTTGYTVSYTSSAPASVQVNASTGVLTGVSGGTAIITATVTYKGSTVKATWPVAVANYPYITDLKVDGTAVDGFSINQSRYTDTVPVSQPAFPDVTFTNPDPANITVTVQKPDKIGGRFTITASKPGEQDMTYMLDLNYPPDAGYNTVVGTIQKDLGMVSHILDDKQTVYIDWSNATMDPAQDGASSVDLTKVAHPENLYLECTISINSSLADKYPNALKNPGGGSNITFRGPDTNGQEGRFGWYINGNWNLQYGDNTIKIPLAQAMTRNTTDMAPDGQPYLNPTSDHDYTVSGYNVNVNGTDVVWNDSATVRERTRGVINWKQVSQALVNLQPAGVTPADIDTFSVTVSDFRFVDETVNAVIADKLAQLKSMTDAGKLPADGYNPTSYAAYSAVFDAAKNVETFADAIGPLDYYINLLQTKINQLAYDMTALQDALTAAEAIKDLSVYTKDSADAFTAALNAANNVAASPENQAAIDAAAAALTAAQSGLKLLPTFKLGDVNNDTKIDTTDARLVLQEIVNKVTFDDTQKLAADVDGNNKIDTVDARLILQYIVNKIDKFPAEQ